MVDIAFSIENVHIGWRLLKGHPIELLVKNPIGSKRTLGKLRSIEELISSIRGFEKFLNDSRIKHSKYVVLKIPKVEGINKSFDAFLKDKGITGNATINFSGEELTVIKCVREKADIKMWYFTGSKEELFEVFRDVFLFALEEGEWSI